MRSYRFWMMLGLVLSLTPLAASCAAKAEDAPKAEAAATIEIAEGAYSLPAPKGWVAKEPRFRNITEHEFAIPAAEGDEQDGRATFSQSGGSIDDNIARWQSQFKKQDKSDVTDKKIADMPVKLVEIVGTYEDKVAPFSPQPGVMRENYSLLGAIVTTPKAGNYYIKFYGPAKTVEANKDAFVKMIEELQAK